MVYMLVPKHMLYTSLHQLMSLREVVTPEILAESPYITLQNLRVKKMDRIILGHINLNSIRQKFHMMADLINGKVDILFVSESKIDSTFPTQQFEIHGYSSPYRLDWTISWGGLLLYTREDIPTRLLTSQYFGKIILMGDFSSECTDMTWLVFVAHITLPAALLKKQLVSKAW